MNGDDDPGAGTWVSGPVRGFRPGANPIFRGDTALSSPASLREWEAAGWQRYGKRGDGVTIYVAPEGTLLPGEGWPLERRNWRIGPWKLLDLRFGRVRLHPFTWYDAWKGAYLRTEKIDGYSSAVTLYILFRRFVPMSVSWEWSWRYEGDPLRIGRIERLWRWITQAPER